MPSSVICCASHKVTLSTHGEDDEWCQNHEPGTGDAEEDQRWERDPGQGAGRTFSALGMNQLSGEFTWIYPNSPSHGFKSSANNSLWLKQMSGGFSRTHQPFQTQSSRTLLTGQAENDLGHVASFLGQGKSHTRWRSLLTAGNIRRT